VAIGTIDTIGAVSAIDAVGTVRGVEAVRLGVYGGEVFVNLRGHGVNDVVSTRGTIRGKKIMEGFCRRSWRGTQNAGQA